jgi:anti-sigma regulatory factor (Ser/Thr protein kinase)
LQTQLDTTTCQPGACCLTLANDYSSLERMAEWLERFADVHALPAQVVFRLDLVLTEAVTNVLDHAYLDHATGRIELIGSVDEGDVQIDLIDDGQPFDPTARAPVVLPRSLDEATPGGLGIHLIHQYTSRLEYRRDDARNVLRFRLPIQPAAKKS